MIIIWFNGSIYPVKIQSYAQILLLSEKMILIHYLYILDQSMGVLKIYVMSGYFKAF